MMRKLVAFFFGIWVGVYLLRRSHKPSNTVSLRDEIERRKSEFFLDKRLRRCL